MRSKTGISRQDAKDAKQGENLKMMKIYVLNWVLRVDQRPVFLSRISFVFVFHLGALGVLAAQ
jgi:hypothetical protein